MMVNNLAHLVYLHITPEIFSNSRKRITNRRIGNTRILTDYTNIHLFLLYKHISQIVFVLFLILLNNIYFILYVLHVRE